MPTEQMSVTSLIHSAERGDSEGERRAALYWLQRRLEPDAVQFVLETHHISASERVISRVTWLFWAIANNVAKPSDDLMERLHQCANLLEGKKFARNWLPYEDWVVGASLWGHSDALTFWDHDSARYRMCMNLNYGAKESDLMQVLQNLAGGVALREEPDGCGLPLDTLDSCAAALGRFTLATLEGAASLVPKESIAHRLIGAEITQRKTLLYRDASLLSEDPAAVARHELASRSACSRTALHGVLALASIGDMRAMSSIQRAEQAGFIGLSDVPEALRECLHGSYQ